MLGTETGKSLACCNVLSAIKFAGVTIAAIWFGGTLFFTFFVAPAFFADPIKTLLPPPYNGQTIMYVFDRFYGMHYLFGTLALLHLGFDWIYTGKTLQRLNVILVGGALALAIFAGKWMDPKLEEYYRYKYAEQYQLTVTEDEKSEYANSFGVWHGVSQGLNLLMLLGLWIYLWQMMHPNEGPKYLGSGKFNIDKQF